MHDIHQLTNKVIIFSLFHLNVVAHAILTGCIVIPHLNITSEGILTQEEVRQHMNLYNRSTSLHGSNRSVSYLLIWGGGFTYSLVSTMDKAILHFLRKFCYIYNRFFECKRVAKEQQSSVSYAKWFLKIVR